MSKLVIVESPAKAKTIKKYLGSGYDVQASKGHVRDLPAKKLCIDIENDFKPQYEIMEGKEDTVKLLKNRAKKSDEVYLATDPDREGEAISWHLAYLLGLDDNEKNRVVFNEITKNGVKSGMENPRPINKNLVDAQQARRILDRIVGYQLSPFISSKIKWGLSAGRVQSVAVRLIVDREKEIRAFVPEESFTIDTNFVSEKNSKLKFSATFYGDKDGKRDLKTKKEAEEVLETLKDASFEIDNIKCGTRKRSTLPPFITSTLQQEASRKLSMSAKKTMKIAQELYEGVEVSNLGAVGLITYMRTDSLRISEDAINIARDYILKNFGEKYLPTKAKRYRSSKNAQDAHEAIRPTMPDLSPKQLQNDLTRDQYRLYKLIWERFMASNMSDCVHDTVQADILGNGLIFKASGFKMAFDGFTALYDEDKIESKKDAALFKLNKGDKVLADEIEANQHFTQPPARYTEASLIKAMEKNGIGRPSTYAATVSTIINRNYVEKEKKNLKPTDLGELTTALLEDKFPKIVDVKFTANMEGDLDKVEEGKEDWLGLLKVFYKEFSDKLSKAEETMKGQKMQINTNVKCDVCGKPMVIKYGKYGMFASCSAYPECKNIRQLKEDGSIMTKEEQKQASKTDEICEKCGKPMIIKQGKYGKFLSCSAYPECKNIKSLKSSKEEDIVTDELCEKCGKPMVIKQGRYGKFLGCSGYPECKNIRKIKKDGTIMSKEEKAQEEAAIKTDEICEKCGKPMIIRHGRFGDFLACSGYPKCRNIKKLKKTEEDEKD